MTSTNTATTTTEVAEPQAWRDYAGSLTPEQIERLDYVERQWHNIFPGAGEDRTGLVRMAAGHAADNAAQVRFAGIAAPADAVDAPGEWREYEGDVWSRFYTIARTELDSAASVVVLGHQFTDGRIERYGAIEGDVDQFDVAQLRALASALQDAADDLDSAIHGNRWPVDSNIPRR